MLLPVIPNWVVVQCWHQDPNMVMYQYMGTSWCLCFLFVCMTGHHSVFQSLIFQSKWMQLTSDDQEGSWTSISPNNNPVQLISLVSTDCWLLFGTVLAAFYCFTCNFPESRHTISIIYYLYSAHSGDSIQLLLKLISLISSYYLDHSGRVLEILQSIREDKSQTRLVVLSVFVIESMGASEFPKWLAGRHLHHERN